MQYSINGMLKADPTRTQTLRNDFSSKVAGKFIALRSSIRRSIVDNDCFGLDESTSNPFAFNEDATPGQFDFPTSIAKIDAFMEWLNEQEEAGILEIIRRPNVLAQGIQERWTDVWIHSAYQKGVLRGRQEIRKQVDSVPSIPPSDVNAITGVLNQPIHADRLGILYTRTFRELNGITRAMDQQISRVLTEGIAQGLNAATVAKNVADRVDKIGITRARVLARTEIIRAHHVANINEYRQWGAQGVLVQAEWHTAGFGVCPICQELEGKVFTLDEIEGMIPRHPNCRCVCIPIMKEDYIETLKRLLAA